MEKDKNSVMWELCDGDINKASGRTAFDAMRKGDATGKAVVDEYINYLSCGLVNVITPSSPTSCALAAGSATNEKRCWRRYGRTLTKNSMP